jgi:hypothetical protein
MTALRKPGSASRNTPGSAYGNQQFEGSAAGHMRSCLACGLFKSPIGGRGAGVRWRCAECLAAKEEAQS